VARRLAGHAEVSHRPANIPHVYVTAIRVLPELADRGWPFTIPAVAHVVRDGLRFSRPVTFLVGPNGAGKSTLIEAMAEAYGVDVRGGHAGRRYASPLPRSRLGTVLRLEMSEEQRAERGRRGRGFFLRAETALGVLEFMNGLPGYGDDLDKKSHGESFLQVFDGRFVDSGLYLLDEPESGLSFTSTLQLVIVLDRLAAEGAQVVCATHSPLLTALPGAEIFQLTAEGIVAASWGDLGVVEEWRSFLLAPETFMRHLLGAEPGPDRR